MAENEYLAEYAKQGRAKCKHSGCKTNIEKDTTRLGKSHPSGFHDGNQTDWYHPKCLFKAFCNAKKGSKIVEDVDDIKGYLTLKKEDKAEISKYFADFQSGKLKKEVLEEKKQKREEKKKEKEMLDKMLGKSTVGSPKKAAPTKKAAATKTKPKNGKSKFIDGLVDSDDENNNDDDERDSNLSSDEVIASSPKKSTQSPKKLQSIQPVVSSPKIKQQSLNQAFHINQNKVKHGEEEELFGIWANSFRTLTSKLPGFGQFAESHRDSLALISPKQNPRVVCVGLSPYQHPLLKYDKAMAYNNILQTLSPPSNFSVFKWFSLLKEKQQFLFLHFPIGESSFDSYWIPLLLKLIKIILKFSEEEKQGIVFALFGSEAHKLSPIILEYFKVHFQRANFRILNFQDLSKDLTEQTQYNNNKKENQSNILSAMQFDQVISAAASEIGLPPIRWYLKKEYAVVLKGQIEGHTLSHTLTQSGNLGRISFADHQLSDKRISRDQLKVEIIEDSNTQSPKNLKITVLGRNPIEIQHEKEERKILNQGETDTLKPGENFNLILGGEFFQFTVAELSEDGSVVDIKSNNNTPQHKRDSFKPSQSFSRSVSSIDTQPYTPTLKRSNSSDLKSPLKSPKDSQVTPSEKPQIKRKRSNEKLIESGGREMRKKGKTVNYKEIGSDDDDDGGDDDDGDDGDDDEALARKIQRKFEKEDAEYQKQKSSTKKRSSDNSKRKLRNKKNSTFEDSSEEDTKRIKAEIADGGPDSPYESDDMWNEDKKFKYKSEEESISHESGEEAEEDDDLDDGVDMPAKKIPCKWGAKCYRKNPDHLREFSHPK